MLHGSYQHYIASPLDQAVALDHGRIGEAEVTPPTHRLAAERKAGGLELICSPSTAAEGLHG